MRSSNQSRFRFEQDLFDEICSMPRLQAAFKAVRKNRGSHGVDGVSLQDYEKELEKNLRHLREAVKGWRYKPQPVRRVKIPKPNGGTRELGVPTIRDRVLQTSMKMALEPILDPGFSENSFGFRPGRSQREAIEQAKVIVNSGREWVVDIDLAKFFDRINHDRLIARLSQVIEDKRVLRLIGITLRSGVMADGVTEPSVEGSVQGSPLSPLLSNFVLDELDKELEKRGHKFCRFADDMNAFVKTPRAAERLLRSLTTFIERKLKLKVNQDKSQVAKSDQVKFLGMTIVACTIAISRKSLNQAMAKVKELIPRGTHLPIEKSIERINTWYKGWSGYFCMTEYPAQLAKIEAHIRRRLRARWVRQQRKRRHIVKNLTKKGVPRGTAFRAVYCNRSTWALSHVRAVEQGLPNKWFFDRGLWIRSQDRLPHWQSINTWIRLT